MDDILKDGKELLERIENDDSDDGWYYREHVNPVVEALIAEIERLRAELALRDQVVRDLGERSI